MQNYTRMSAKSGILGLLEVLRQDLRVEIETKKFELKIKIEF